MRAILEYQLPEETDEYELAMDGNKRASALDQIDMELRSIVKYENFAMFSNFTFKELESEETKELVISITNAIRSRIAEILIENGVTT